MPNEYILLSPLADHPVSFERVSSAVQFSPSFEPENVQAFGARDALAYPPAESLQFQTRSMLTAVASLNFQTTNMWSAFVESQRPFVSLRLSSNAPFAPYCACVAEFVATAPESAVVSGTKMSLLTGVTVTDAARRAAGSPAPQTSIDGISESRLSSSAASETSCHWFQSCVVNVTDATSVETAGTPPETRTAAVTDAAGCAASLKRATAVPPSSTETESFSATTAIASAHAGSGMR